VKTPSVFVRASCVFVAGFFLLFALVPAFAAQPEPLDTNAIAQIAAIYREKLSWTPAQCKLESQLIHAMKNHRGETYAPGAPDLEMDVKLRTDGRVLVDINATVTPTLLQLITNGGGTVINQFPNFHAIRAIVTLDELETLVSSADVRTIRRATQARHHTGAVNSEGDTTHQAIEARATFGVTGAGVKVGVLSDSVTTSTNDFLTDAQATGDLGPVTVLQDIADGTGEGAAMLEIVHDLAPGAQLYFATSDESEAGFAENILNLRNAGCDIILDDTGYFDESPFEDGIIAQAVNTVTDNGALYFSAAGNAGNLDSGTSGTWEGDFVDGGAAASPITEAGRVQSFGAQTFDTISFADSDSHLDLFWSDPLGASTNDYDVFVLNSSGTRVQHSSTTRQNGTQDPYESIPTLSSGQRIVIVKFSGAARFLHLDTGDGELSIATSGATLGHACAANAFCVAAVDEANSFPKAFTAGTNDPVEFFSSDGPRHIFYNSDGVPITPGNVSSTGGAIRQKPDVAAADGVSTTFADFTPFFGTSAATPHAAAIAALLKSYSTNITTAQVRAILTGTALDIMAAGVDRDSGYGIVMAFVALDAASPDTMMITPRMGFVASGSIGGPFDVATQNLFLTNSGSSSLDWTLVNTSAWLNVSSTNGTLAPGGPTTTVTVSLNAATSNLAAGNYTATIVFSNLATQIAQTRTYTLSVTGPSSYGNAALALRPLAYWRLDETNQPPRAAIATNAGSLGNSGTGFVINNVTPAQPGIVGTSFHFSNPELLIELLGGHVDIPYTPALNPNGPFTIELWANPAQITSDFFSPAAALDANQNDSNARIGWILYEAAGSTWQFRVGGINGYAATLVGGTVTTGAWHHLVGVYDGTNASFYVNGVLVAGPSSAAGFNPNTTMPLRIGATTIPNRTFDGDVDEVAFYTNALSPDVIASHYNTAISAAANYSSLILTSHPVGYWHLDDPAPIVPNLLQLPLAVNLGSLAPTANGIYEPGTFPGALGVPTIGLGASNLACMFDGFGNIDVPATNSLNLTGALSLVAWTKALPASGSAQSILDHGIGSYRLFLDSAGLPHFSDGLQPSGDVVGPTRLDNNQWHQLIGVYDGASQQTLYVDGQVSASINNATTAVSGNSDDLWIGGDPDTNAFQFFNGEIDEVAIFGAALSPMQVQQIYLTSTNNPPLRFTAIGSPTASSQTIALTFSTIPGQKYQLQFKTDLTQPLWTNLGNPIIAVNSTTTISDPLGTNVRRFYRLLLL
jgi:hypothetical protein